MTLGESHSHRLHYCPEPAMPEPIALGARVRHTVSGQTGDVIEVCQGDDMARVSWDDDLGERPEWVRRARLVPIGRL